MHIAGDLLHIAKGEVLDDSWSRRVYSADASNYEVEPRVVVCPIDEDDVQQMCQYSFAKKIPITARGAGTGLLGQSLSEGMILDFTKHMDKIIEIGEDYVIVQPGIVKGFLDKELRKRNKFLPPDPASSNYCTVGGMIADNSSGIHSLGYGSTIDYLDEIKMVYADGKIGFASTAKYDSRMKELCKLLSSYLHEIRISYPDVSKNSCGYRLDAVVRDKFNPHKVFAASEGTLGVLTSAKLEILDMPTHRCMMVLAFEDLIGALLAVPRILKFSPVAVEMLDHTAIVSDRSKASDAGCLLFIEFAGTRRRSKLESRMTACRQMLVGKCSVLEYASDEESMTKIWGARRSALNSIMKLTVGSRKPLGLIEDTVVPPDILVNHATNLLQIYRENRLDYVLYGHVGNGNIHTRPLIDTASAKQIELMRNIASKVFGQVINGGGTISGEHGDGLTRTCYIEMMYGKRMSSLFSMVKKLFDPSFTMNPGKKVPVQLFMNGVG
ncbi:MAG TPA: FAD-binding oxidoreductase [Nitrososphaera sp.]|nr:FAD-binding oxidoreductase [Nitrososphaera sp.]